MQQFISDISRPAHSSIVDRITEVADLLGDAAPEQTLRWAFDEFKDGLTIATGFGAEGIVLIDMAMRINPRADVFFLDTGFLFPETYDLRRQIEDRYDIRIRSFRTGITPDKQELDYGPKLWATDPDLCCRIRKLEPLKSALRGRDAWITGIRSNQTLERSNARVVEWDIQWKLVKINPLLRWTRQQVWDYISANGLPYNPLHDKGYPSLGCTQCTQPVRIGESERAGRWAGRAKTECGLHAAPKPPSLAVRSEEVSNDVS